ncbi:CDGSH iron-sulfur domain-containing protein 3, mitochondrial [Lithobates pipiens]
MQILVVRTIAMKLIQGLRVIVAKACSTSQVTPVIAAKHPFKVDLKAGKLYPWCSCGHSKKQETHLDGSRVLALCRAWIQRAIHATYSTYSRGVSILISKAVPCTIHHVISDPGGDSSGWEQSAGLMQSLDSEGDTCNILHLLQGGIDSNQ